MNKIDKTLKMFLLATAMLPLCVFSQSKMDKKVLMTIGGTPITVQEFVQVYNKNNVNNEVIEKKAINDYLDLFINFKVKVREAEELQLDTMPIFVKELAKYRSQLAKPYFSSEEINEDLIKEAYQRKLKDIRASHILVAVNRHALPADTLKAYNKAMELRKRILNGEDFSKVAVEASDDISARDIPASETSPARKGNRGDLGYFTVFDMVYPFETGAYNTPVGQISMPVRTDYGYHLIKVNEVSDAIGTVQVAHIFLALPDDASAEQVKATEDKANKIYEELQNNPKAWDVSVSKYTDDRGTIQYNGKLTKFTVSRIVPEFITAIKQMQPGQISKPVRTNFGFHIIRLISLEQPRTFELEKQVLKERIEKDMRSKKSEEIVLAKIKEDNHFKEKQKNLYRFIGTIDSTLVQGRFKVSDKANTKAVLFSIDKNKYTVGDFIDFINKVQMNQTNIDAEAYALSLYQRYVNESLINYEDLHLEEKYPDFKYLVQEYHDGILLFDLMERMVWNKAGLDTVGLQQFYEQNKNNYMWGNRVEAAVIQVLDNKSLNDAMKIVNDPEIEPTDYRNIIRRDSIQNVVVRYGYYQKGDNHAVDETEWIPGTIVSYPSTVDNSTTIVRIVSTRQPEPKQLKEARGLVTSDYQVELEKNWIKELRAKYPVEVNSKVLNELTTSHQ